MTNYNADAAAAQMTDLALVKRFVLGGVATFTLRSLETGARFTYRVTRAKRTPGQDDSKRPYFVSVLASDNNTGDYEYAGCIWPSTNEFAYGKKSRLGYNSTSVRAFQWFWTRACLQSPMSELEFWHAGTCARCGRLLTVPESIESGFGPYCATQL